jgi:hypothetical protein
VQYSYSWATGGSYCPCCQVQIYAGFVGSPGTCPLGGFSNYPIKFSQNFTTTGCQLIVKTFTYDYRCETVAPSYRPSAVSSRAPSTVFLSYRPLISFMYFLYDYGIVILVVNEHNFMR